MPLPGPHTLADMVQRARNRLRYWERELERNEASGGQIDRMLRAELQRARSEVEILERALASAFD
jgi:hypothetical protein